MEKPLTQGPDLPRVDTLPPPEMAMIGGIKKILTDDDGAYAPPSKR